MVLTCRFYKQKYPEVNKYSKNSRHLKKMGQNLLNLIFLDFAGRGCRYGERKINRRDGRLCTFTRI